MWHWHQTMNSGHYGTIGNAKAMHINYRPIHNGNSAILAWHMHWSGFIWGYKWIDKAFDPLISVSMAEPTLASSTPVTHRYISDWRGGRSGQWRPEIAGRQSGPPSVTSSPICPSNKVSLLHNHHRKSWEDAFIRSFTLTPPPWLEGGRAPTSRSSRRFPSLCLTPSLSLFLLYIT